jgi:hypothetical protein
MGVMEPDPPEVNLAKRPEESSSSRSSRSVGMKEGAFGFLPGLEEDIFKCGVARS